MEVEKNDVDISKLFIWGRVFEIVNSSGEVESKVYMRLLGDADVNKARVHALRKSAHLREKLLDLESDERAIFIKPSTSMGRDDLLNYIIVFSMREITNSSYKNVNVKRPTAPKSNAPLAKLEKYQKELDDYPKQVKKAVEKQIHKEVDTLRKSLSEKSTEELYKMYVDSLVNELCEQEALNSYKNVEVYYGCYKDENYKERYFPSFDEYDNLDSEVKAEFRAAFERLDMKMDDLKKLREATL